MKKWILKPGQERFEVVDGVLAGRKFQPGKVYSEIPEPEKERFELWVAPAPSLTATKPETASKKTTENKR